MSNEQVPGRGKAQPVCALPSVLPVNVIAMFTVLARALLELENTKHAARWYKHRTKTGTQRLHPAGKRGALEMA